MSVLHDIRCLSCGAPSNVLGATESHRNRLLQHCECSACSLRFDRITASNGRGMTTLYAVPPSTRSNRFVRVIPSTREDAHAS